MHALRSRLPLFLFALLGALPARAGLLDTASDADEGILPVGQAFQLQPATWDGKTLTLGWEIAPGCYLYRDRLRVQVLSPDGYALGAPELPAGKVEQDEEFGAVTIYETRAEIRFHPQAAQPPQRLRVRYQGCARDRVCYPPQTRDIDVDTP